MLADARGDTIIEVLLAVAIFSLVSVGATTIMNQGTNAAQRALEITLVRQQIDAQAESLRAAHQAYTTSPATDKSDTEWQQILDQGEAGSAGEIAGGCPQPQSSAFVMDPTNATLRDGTWFTNMNDSDKPYSQYDPDSTQPAHGIWIERQQINQAPITDAQEFTIRTCWFGAGLDTPLTIDTVVRLYDPAA